MANTFSTTLSDSPGQLDLSSVISDAREITGNKADVAVGETMIPDAAITIALEPIIRDLCDVFGNNQATKEIVFTSVAMKQDYLLATYVGTDVFNIVDVERSGAYVPENFLSHTLSDPRTGMPFNDTIIQSGMQGNAMDAIAGAYRFHWRDRFCWELVNDDTLRIMPTPVTSEYVMVRYISTGYGISSLPNRVRPAMVWAACVAIFDMQLNRIMTDRVTSVQFKEAKDERIKVVARQRDYYENKFRSEMAKLGG